MESDHVWPKSRGGPDAAWNRQKLCRTCNRRKYTRYADYRLRNLLALVAAAAAAVMLVVFVTPEAADAQSEAPCSYDAVERMGFEDGREVRAVPSPYAHCLEDAEWAGAYQSGFTYGLFDTTIGAPSYQWRQSYGYLESPDYGTWDDDYPIVLP
jgi:hypothetical protein